MKSIREEISRVEAAIEKTKSPTLKRDYEKHLKRLRQKLKRGD